MVLIAILWLVAALGIIVAGMTRSVRDDARIAAQERQELQGAAVGEAAIQLALQELAASPGAIARLTSARIVYRGIPIQVQIMPINGLIDINGAPIPLLASLYAVAGGMGEAPATALAQATADTRTHQNVRGEPMRFEAPEDLLRVPGVDYDLYARLSGFIAATAWGNGKVNPMAAPEGVLAVLAGGNRELAARIAQARDAGAEGIDTTALGANFIGGAAMRQVRIRAFVPLPDGGRLRVTQDVNMNAWGRDGLPWKIYYTERNLAPPAPKDS